MRIRAVIVAASAALFLSVPVSASGPMGVYGIIEKVVFEPDEARAERIQVWGAFAYVDGGASSTLGVSKAERGYLYFRLPDPNPAPTGLTDLVRREWADLKAVAGGGQVVGFGRWRYTGAFQALNPGASSATPPHIYAVTGGGGGGQTDLRVRPATEKPTAPATYQTDSGIVKLSANGNRADIVKQLQDALRK